MRTAQELFDTAIIHLRKQGQKSVSMDYAPGYTCRYRSPEGLKCPIGVLIPDTVYKPEMEEKSFDMLLHSNLLPIDLQAEFQVHARASPQAARHSRQHLHREVGGWFLPAGQEVWSQVRHTIKDTVPKLKENQCRHGNDTQLCDVACGNCGDACCWHGEGSCGLCDCQKHTKPKKKRK